MGSPRRNARIRINNGDEVNQKLNKQPPSTGVVFVLPGIFWVTIQK